MVVQTKWGFREEVVLEGSLGSDSVMEVPFAEVEETREEAGLMGGWESKGKWG